MKPSITTSMARLPRFSSGRTALGIGLLLVLCCQEVAADPARPLFDGPRPAPVRDEVFLISTRAMGTVCCSEQMSRKLSCQRLVAGPTGSTTWQTSDWRRLLSSEDRRPTIIYVHGNRVAPGQDSKQGLQIYESLKKHGQRSGPIRFIIWSWPATQIPGLVKDYRVKAQRTTPAAWQLAWLLDRLPVENSISLVGYSYGTRVVSGAAHLLAGGNLGPLRLKNRRHAEGPSVRVALIAAAYDADWIQPKHFYGRSTSLIDRLVLVTNELDPAMRFYHLSNGRGRMHALGKSGVHRPSTLGARGRRFRQVDFTGEVGRSHALVDYLAADGKMQAVWQQLLISRGQSLIGDSGDSLSRGYLGFSSATRAF